MRKVVVRSFIWGLLSFAVMVIFSFPASGEEELLELRITRCVRPNLVVAEVVRGKEPEKVRVKLAGILPPLENPEVYRQALARLRELVEGQEVRFDFALGHSLGEYPWVGYLYVERSPDEEPCIVNAALLCEGLVTLDEKTAGKNMLGYLLSMQQTAQEEGLGLWKKVQKEGRGRTEEECPSCTIR